jgi:hypothetical protein
MNYVRHIGTYGTYDKSSYVQEDKSLHEWKSIDSLS